MPVTAFGVDNPAFSVGTGAGRRVGVEERY
jgi:hypothetical protein